MVDDAADQRQREAMMTPNTKGLIAMSILGVLFFALKDAKATPALPPLEPPPGPRPYVPMVGHKVVTTRRTGWYGDPNPNTQGANADGSDMTVPEGIILNVVESGERNGFVHVELPASIADVVFNVPRAMFGWVPFGAVRPGEGNLPIT